MTLIGRCYENQNHYLSQDALRLQFGLKLIQYFHVKVFKVGKSRSTFKTTLLQLMNMKL